MDGLLSVARKVGGVGSGEELAGLMKKWEGASKVLKKNVAHIDQALADRAVVDPHHHSFAFIHLLIARLEVALDLHQQHTQRAGGGGGGGGAAAALPPALLLHCHELFVHFSPSQVSACLADLFHLSSLFTRLAIALHRPSAPLLSFSSALQRLHQHYPHVLTPLHTHLVQLCVLSKHYHFALPILRLPLYSTRPRSEGMDAVLYLSFYYHAGLVWCVYRQWSRAVEALHLCLAAPGNAVSAIQVAAYKKLILAQLLDTGEAPTLPARVTSPALLRHLDPLVQPYLDLAKAFARSVNTATSLPSAALSPSTAHSTSSSNAASTSASTSSSSSSSKEAADVSSLHAQHVDVWTRDHNHGLVKQLSTHLLHLQVQRLTSTYLTLPLQQLAGLVHSPPSAVEQWLALLIAQRRITARIDTRIGLVSFIDAEVGAEEEEADAAGIDLLHSIHAQIEQLLALRHTARYHAAALSLNPVFVAKALQSERGEETAGGGGGGGGVGGRGAVGLEVSRGSFMRGQRGAAATEEEQLRLAMQASIAEQ